MKVDGSSVWDAMLTPGMTSDQVDRGLKLFTRLRGVKTEMNEHGWIASFEISKGSGFDESKVIFEKINDVWYLLSD
jgi:hypothetical protein